MLKWLAGHISISDLIPFWTCFPKRFELSSRMSFSIHGLACLVYSGWRTAFDIRPCDDIISGVLFCSQGWCLTWLADSIYIVCLIFFEHEAECSKNVKNPPQFRFSFQENLLLLVLHNFVQITNSLNQERGFGGPIRFPNFSRNPNVQKIAFLFLLLWV